MKPDTKNKFMQKEIMERFTVYAAVFAVFSLAVMCYRAVSRPAVITAAAQAQNELVSLEEGNRLPLTLTRPEVQGAQEAADIVLPLPEDVNASDVRVDNHYVTREVRVHFPGGAVSSYLEQTITADPEKVTGGYVVPDGAGGMVLCFLTDRIYEVATEHYRGELRLILQKPEERYDVIVVIDPIGGGSEDGGTADGVIGKEVSLAIATIVQERINARTAEDGIRAFLTRTWDEAVSDDARTALAQALDADLYLRIGTDEAAEDDSHGISVYYNEVYFRRGFNNVQFADLLLRQTAVAAGKEAYGMEGAYADDPVLTALTCPAAKICAGFLTSEADRADLAQEDYHKKVADGIYKAVTDAASMQ